MSRIVVVILIYHRHKAIDRVFMFWSDSSKLAWLGMANSGFVKLRSLQAYGGHE
jgi:hypothetical protein